jgi:hypothetical protein
MRQADEPTRPDDPIQWSFYDATGLADFICQVIEIILGVNPDVRRPAFFIAISAGAVRAAGAGDADLARGQQPDEDCRLRRDRPSAADPMPDGPPIAPQERTELLLGDPERVEPHQSGA